MPPAENNSPETILGIDLGTTNSLVAVLEDAGPRVLDIDDGSPILPSVVRYSADGADVEAVGSAARSRAVEFPTQTVSSVKRLMGRSVQDAAPDLAFLSYEVVEGERHAARVRIGECDLWPQEVSAVILKTIRERAEQALGHSVRKAVVTVPAYFDDAQRQATRDAGRIAGLDVVRIVNEPTAAALAYGVGVRNDEPQKIAVFDLGGGTFDVSILQLTPSGQAGLGADCFQVLSTAGDTRLGGDDVDRMIIELLLEEIRRDFYPDLAPDAQLGIDPATRQALRNFAEAAKIHLSDHDAAQIQIDLGEGRSLERMIMREEFESLIADWAQRAIDCCARALSMSGLNKDDVERVVMVGGSTRIPLVRRMVGEFFDVDPYTALDPDQVVAMGAAVQAGIISGADRSRLLLDVIPLSLGIETVGGGVAKMIMANQMTPARATEKFSTSVDGQTNVKIHVVQGEREMVEDCRSLGQFDLSGVPPMPAGVPKLEVEFLVDANGILNVSAVEQRSGKRASLQVAPNHGLSREEVARMEAESFEHAKEDLTRHRVTDLITNSRLDLKWIRDGMVRVGDELPDDVRAPLEEKAAALESLIEQARADWRTVDPDAFAQAKQSLDEASVRLHEISIAKSLRDESA